MNKWEEDLKKDKAYQKREEELKIQELKFNKNINPPINADSLFSLYKRKNNMPDGLTETEKANVREIRNYYLLLSEHLKQNQFFYAGYFGKVDNPEELEKDIDTLNKKLDDIEMKIVECKNIVYKESERLETEFNNTIKEEFDNALYLNNNKDLVISNEYVGVTFESLIEDTDNAELAKWYAFLKELYDNPYRTFFLNENTVCNFKIVFRNPKTGLYTDKEPVVQIGHSTSSKKTPVFGIGYNTYKAYSMGPKLLAGTIVTNNFNNIPLAHLHSISYADHISAEDLPPLDLYIIPIKHINENGRFEIVMIKGIQFIDMKENDNAASTGLYYAFQYFAEDIMVLDYEDLADFYSVVNFNTGKLNINQN